jgi:hypothetical protein
MSRAEDSAMIRPLRCTWWRKGGLLCGVMTPLGEQQVGTVVRGPGESLGENLPAHRERRLE